MDNLGRARATKLECHAVLLLYDSSRSLREATVRKTLQEQWTEFGTCRLKQHQWLHPTIYRDSSRTLGIEPIEVPEIMAAGPSVKKAMTVKPDVSV